jgi:hypothetical protein
LWEIDKEHIYEELIALFDYRQWKERFTACDMNSSETWNSVPDDDEQSFKSSDESSISSNSSSSSSSSALSSSSCYVPQRRKREMNWTNILSSLSASNLSATDIDCNFKTKAFVFLEEANEFRVTLGDIVATKELVIYLQRLRHHQESVKWIDTLQQMYEKNDTTLTKIELSPFIKLKGIALLKHGQMDSARTLLAEYRHIILSECEEAHLLGRPTTFFNTLAETYNEIATVALLETEYRIAFEYALKALKLDESLLPVIIL